MSRVFIVREVEAISQDFHDIANALKTECDRIVETAKEIEEHPDQPVKGAMLRPIDHWERLLAFELSRLGCLITHLKDLD